MRSCLAVVVDKLIQEVKTDEESRVPVRQFVQHKQGPRVDPRFGEMDHERHPVEEMGGMVNWDDVEDAEVQGDLVEPLD